MKRGDVPFEHIPDTPGVYFFRRAGAVEYVGKATSLRSRVRSYFDNELEEKRGLLVKRVVDRATDLTWEVTDSVLEALLLEAKYINELKPVGNTLAKDDKSYNYVVITKEEFPRVITVRGRELAARIAPTLRKKVYGPFTQGASLKAALNIIRKIFPHFDTSFPISGHRMSRGQEKTLRFNQAIGKYPREDRAAYKKTIRNIEYLFEGRKGALVKSLEREMRASARAEAFEKAGILKRQVFALKHIQDSALLKDEYRAPRSAGYRIEAYDTAHLRGSSPRGVMVVVVDGEPQKDAYRIFTIRSAKAGDDYEALREVLGRRLAHTEWPYPKLIVIDGGHAHLKVARAVLSRSNLDIEVCAVVKDERHKPREILGKRATAAHHKGSILLANAEAHRFSIGRHRRAQRKALH